MKDIFERLIELIKEDPELREAIIALVKAKTLSEFELANWRKRRA